MLMRPLPVGSLMRSLRANTALEQRGLFRVSRMKRGIYLRERCRIYAVATERDLALAMPVHRSRRIHNLPVGPRPIS
jgi:hypothetical protein